MKLRRRVPSTSALVALCMATAAMAGPVGGDAPEAPAVKPQDAADLEALILPKGLTGDAVKPTTIDAAASATRAARQARLAALIAEREARAAARAAAGGNATSDSHQPAAAQARSDAGSMFDNSAADLDKSAAAQKDSAGKVPERVSYTGPAGDGRSNYDSGNSPRGLADSMTPEQRNLAREAITYVKGLLADPLTWFLLIPVGLGAAALAVMARRR